jgi:hypothetical protein
MKTAFRPNFVTKAGYRKLIDLHLEDFLHNDTTLQDLFAYPACVAVSGRCGKCDRR